MNLTHFLLLCVFFADTFFRSVESKSALSNGPHIKILAEPLRRTTGTKFSVVPHAFKSSDINDSDERQYDEGESNESEEEEERMNGIVSESPSQSDDDKKYLIVQGKMIVPTSRLVKVKRAVDSSVKSRKSDKTPDSPKADNIASIDEEIANAKNVTVQERKMNETMKPATKASSGRNKHRRNSEVAKWPPALPYSETNVHLYVGNAESPDGPNSSDKTINSEGGIISSGKVGTSSEETTDSEMNRGTTEQGEHVTVTYAPELPSEDIKGPTKKQPDNTKINSGSKTTMKPAGRHLSGSTHNQIIRKPGKCRPLTSGLACIALSPDSSQCSTDNSCPSTKKCCFYGCAPYTGIGICEFPIMN